MRYSDITNPQRGTAGHQHLAAPQQLRHRGMVGACVLQIMTDAFQMFGSGADEWKDPGLRREERGAGASFPC
ncbi:MAG: hypothetical protein WBC93_06285 [Sulfitobacter sp.]